MLAVSNLHREKSGVKNRTMTWISTIQKESQTMQMILDVTQSWDNTMENILEYDVSDQCTL